MSFWKDKKGNQLSRKEFIEKWKEGIQKVTPLQQTNIQLRSTKIMLIGITAGIIVSLFKIKTLWWMLLVLLGVLGVTLMQFVNLFQKRNALKMWENLGENQKEVNKK